MTARVYAVSQIVGYMKGLLERDVLLNGFFMEGELSNCKRHSSGHFYFTIKDDSAAIAAVMFRGDAQALAFRPEDGMKVIAYGRVSVYEKTGQTQLYAELLEPMGKGGLFAAFEQLKAKLAAEGLFDPARKRPLPAKPRCIAVVTSPTGAAVHDIITVIRRRSASVSVIIAPAVVQGASAGADIVRAIAEVNRWGKADVLIVGRGGGSAEDLWAFNEEAVARAIVKSKIPVVSAVGHETDFTIADFAADLRAATPSAAAELVTPDEAAVLRRLKDAYGLLHMAMENRLAYARERLTQSVQTMNDAMRGALEARHMRLTRVAETLHILSPLQTLKRGYAFVTDTDGAAVPFAARLLPGANIRLTFADGYTEAEVTAVHIDGAQTTAEKELSHG